MTRCRKPSLSLPETVLIPLVRRVADIRNICAHQGRLWNRGFLVPSKLAQKPAELAATLDVQATQAPARLYNGLVMIGHVVATVAPQSAWRSDLREHLLTHPEGELNLMGFPDDWLERPLWQ